MKSKRSAAPRGEGRTKRRRGRRIRRRRENKRAIGNRTESFSLACLACYDGISEMAKLSLASSYLSTEGKRKKESERKRERERGIERVREGGEGEKVRHKKRVTIQKTLHPVARATRSARLSVRKSA